jgi:lysophospholipase L1-like esterase
VILGLDLVTLAAVLLLFLLAWKGFERLLTAPAHNSPEAWLASRPGPGPGSAIRRPLAVCLGDSITRATISADYVGLLSSRLGDWDFVNAGVNSELAYNLTRRLDSVIALDPDAVTILVGSNDVNATFGFRSALGYFATQRLPERPNPLFFRENLVGMVRRLRRETRAAVALFSMPPIGEESGHYAYLRTEEYANIVRGVAREEGVAYLPLRERMCDYLEALPRGRREPPPFRRFRAVQARAIRSLLILGKSLDEISAANGFHLLVDGIHLNTHGASIVADLAEGFIRGSCRGCVDARGGAVDRASVAQDPGRTAGLAPYEEALSSSTGNS